VKVRDIQPQELRALLALYEHLHDRDDPVPEQAVVESAWLEAMSNPRIRYFGGYAAGELVSSCTLTIVPNLTRACRPYGVIENVVTHAEHRGQGWGKALLLHALTFAWAQHCYKVMLLTGRKDEGTLRFYEQAGFDRHGKQAFVAKPAP
jgi:GNAT superfamily N-acetyltransferase